MPQPVPIKDIVDVLEMQIDEARSFVDLDTGKVETVTLGLLSEAQEGDPGEEPDLPEWQIPEWELAKRIVASDRFKELPDKFDVHEWEIMREFSESVESPAVRRDLLDAIHGAGAFRHFKHVLRLRGIEDAWYDFRTEALRQIAIDWCDENAVPWM